MEMKRIEGKIIALIKVKKLVPKLFVWEIKRENLLLNL